jgi:hypothetical protein
LRKDVEDTQAAMAAAGSETEVRELVAAINERIRAVNRQATSGPPSSLVPFDVERAVAQWREGRDQRGAAGPQRPS